jgi:hypothetical protein
MYKCKDIFQKLREKPAVAGGRTDRQTGMKLQKQEEVEL